MSDQDGPCRDLKTSQAGRKTAVPDCHVVEQAEGSRFPCVLLLAAVITTLILNTIDIMHDSSTDLCSSCFP